MEAFKHYVRGVGDGEVRVTERFAHLCAVPEAFMSVTLLGNRLMLLTFITGVRQIDLRERHYTQARQLEHRDRTIL